MRADKTRLPAPCKHCGQRVFLRFNPTFWCDAGSDEPHACKLGNTSGARAAQTAGHRGQPRAKRGQQVKIGTRVKNLAKRVK